MQRTTALRASSAMEGARGRGSPKKRGRKEPASQSDAPGIHAVIGGFVAAADQIVMRGDPQSDHRNKDAENAGDHAKCK